MLLIDLEKLPEQGECLDREVGFDQLGRSSDEFRLPEPVRLTGRLSRLEADVYALRGDLHTNLEVDCFRCLEAVSVEIQERLELMYIPYSSNVEGDGASQHRDEDRRLEDDEMSVSYYREQEVDLGQLIWEQLHLALPMKIVCREDCLGLCSRCGVNRNEESCDCDQGDIDPRLAELKALLESAQS